MAFDWREYLNLGRFLQDGITRFSPESASRCTISRAYYAAFCHARNYARDRANFIPTNTPEDHTLVRDHFAVSRNQVSLSLDLLRQWRNKCDYADVIRAEYFPIWVPESIEYAQEIIEELTTTL